MKKLLTLTAALLLAFTVSAHADERGSFRLDDFSGGAMGIHFIDICMDDEAAVFSLWTNGDVTDVVLDEVTFYDPIQDEFYDDHAITRTVWTADTLASNDVLCLQAYPGEAFPRFRVTCINESGERERWYITQSGEDGSWLLTAPEDVETVFPVIMPYLSLSEQTWVNYHDEAEQDAAMAEYLAETIWEDQRIIAWGGYAQSYAEQDWIAARDAVDDTLTRAAMTREHVYMLAGKEVPSMSAYASFTDENGVNYPLFEIVRWKEDDQHHVTEVTGHFQRIAVDDCEYPENAPMEDITLPLAADFHADLLSWISLDNLPQNDLYAWYNGIYYPEKPSTDNDPCFLVMLQLNENGEIGYMQSVYVPWG